MAATAEIGQHSTPRPLKEIKHEHSASVCIVVNSYFIAGPAAQESGADRKAVEGVTPAGVQYPSRRTVSTTTVEVGSSPQVV